jgi:thiol peroxidase
MNERTGIITFKGNGLTLQGTPVEKGGKAPDFTVLANDLSPRTLADYKGKVLILSSTPPYAMWKPAGSIRRQPTSAMT